MKISAIVPAYNEEERIEKVIQPLQATDIIDEIIIIDDGSEDKTADVAGNYDVRVIRLGYNQGKSEAVKKGLMDCNAEIILLLDADLIGLTSDHIIDLLKPLIYEDFDMTIGIFNDGRFITDLAQKISPNLSGQRAITRVLADKLVDLDTKGYGIELALSNMAKKEHLKIKRVIIKNATHVMKEEKLGLVKGGIWRLKMYKDIVKSWLN